MHRGVGADWEEPVVGEFLEGGPSVDVLRRSGEFVTVESSELARLAGSLSGSLVTPDSADYDVARRVWNGMIDKRPALIAVCASAADVAATLRFCRAQDLVTTVRGGGHNAAGVAVCDAGVVLDLSGMKQISLDADEAGPIVHVGAGCTIGELDAATQARGLAVPMGVVTETGIAGLTLGGGYGWLRRKFGLACDNLLAAEVVLSDGTLVTTSESERPELLWGLRGGGGTFGVVTTFTFRAHPVGPDVFFALVMHAGTDAAATLRFYREWARTAPDEVSALAVLWHAPPLEEIPAEHHGRPIVALAVAHSGSPAEGEAALATLRAFGSPIADLSATTPFLEVQTFFDEDYPKWEMRYYWTSAFVHDLSDELIDVLVAANEASPSPHSTIDVWQGGGAVARVPRDATAIGDRSASFMLGIEANWEDPDQDDLTIAWARDVVRRTAPWSTGGRYANFPGGFEEDDRPDFFGGNADRVSALKAQYDPDHVFGMARRAGTSEPAET